jgi:hypothetical protein
MREKGAKTVDTCPKKIFLQGGVKCGIKRACDSGIGVYALNEAVDAPELEQECEVRITSYVKNIFLSVVFPVKSD